MFCKFVCIHVQYKAVCVVHSYSEKLHNRGSRPKTNGLRVSRNRDRSTHWLMLTCKVMEQQSRERAEMTQKKKERFHIVEKEK